MKKFNRVAMMAMVFVVFSGSAALAQLPDFTQMVQAAGQAVVNISTERMINSGPMGNMPDGFERFFEQFNPFGNQQDQQSQGRTQTSLGSGFIISADGYVVTNNHVVEGADKVLVIFDQDSGNTRTFTATVVGTDPETDLALLKIESSEALPTLQWGNSDELKVGEWVLAIGNPYGLSHTVTAGILSATGRNISSGAFDDYLQTDASINLGNSGGPLLNMRGEVIGINTAILSSGQGIGFAIPSGLARNIIEQLKTETRVSRGWMGVTIQDLSEEMATALGMDYASGVLLGSVHEGQPAERAGLRAGDIIIKIGDADIRNSDELLRVVADIRPGTTVSVVYLRGGVAETANVVLGDRSTQNVVSSSPNQLQPEHSANNIGLSLRNLTQNDLHSLQLPDGIRGVLVQSVEAGSVSERAGLYGGDVIVSVNLKPVQNVNDFQTILNSEGNARGAVMLQVNRRGESFFVTVSIPE